MLNKNKAQKTATSKKNIMLPFDSKKFVVYFWYDAMDWGCYCMQQFDEFETIS